MNVLIIGTTDILGGAAKISWTLKTALEKSGHNVSMYVADKRSDDPNVKAIHRIGWRKVLGFLLNTERFIDTDWLLETAEYKEADIVHCHNLHGRFFNLETLAKISKEKPVVWTLHDEWAITPHCACTLEGTKIENGFYVCPSKNTPPRILWNNTKQLCKEKEEIYTKARLHLVTPSIWLSNRVKNTPLAKQDLKVIPNGIDTNVFTRTEKAKARELLNLPQDKKIVLFLAAAGKDNPWKGWEYTNEVIESYKTDKATIFLNVGGFSEEDNTENIVYRPYTADATELALYYSAADVLLFTSVAENLPLVVLEAMSCGLPIVSFAVGGVSEVITHKVNGFIAEYKNSEEFKEGVHWLLSLSEAERTQMANDSIWKIKQKYDTKPMIDSYFALYKTLTK